MAFLPALAAISGIVGTIASGIGAFQQAQAQSAAAKYNAEVQRRNAVIAADQGKLQTDDLARQQEEQLGKIRASYGAAGVEMSGDALGLYADSAAEANYDMAKTRYNTKLREIGYQDQANLDEMESKEYSSAAMFGLIGSAANVVGAGVKGYDTVFNAT